MDASIRRAIARIDIVQAGKSGSRGTGFLVAPHLVLTAFHVVADRSAPGVTLYPGQIALTFPTHSTDATVADGHADPRSDWILLRCQTPPPDVRPIPLADSVDDGASWETYGFPDANPRDGMVQIGSVENAGGTFEGVPAYQLFSRQAAAGTGAPVKGLSGGPVIVEGAIVGLLRSSLMRDGQNVAGTLYGCPLDLILERCGDLLPIPDPCRGLPGLPRRPLPATPFRYLERFTSQDAEIFFGRNREIRQLYDHVTSESGAGVVLLYGQSGAGKSSFLDAGLLPRLEASQSTIYVRRDRATGLLGTLLDAVAPALPAAAGAGQSPSLHPAEALRLAWLGTETATGRPLVIVLDQVEEVFTLPSDDLNELTTLVDALAQVSQPGSAPRGRLILGFRKEWFAEIQKLLDDRGVEYTKVFLDALDRDAVIEIVTGLHRTKRLRDRYGLEVEAGLAGAIARDLTADRDSPVAPTLQVLLSRLWREATAASAHAPRFTLALYERVRSDGVLLADFLDQQLAVLRQTAVAAAGNRQDVVDSGLALDLLAFHTTAFATAEQRSAADTNIEYRHRAGEATWLVQELKRLFLLTDPPGDAGHSRDAARLSHDTLAQVVRARFEESGRPGQRARRILQNRASEWTGERTGIPLDSRDLALVEQGLGGMRALRTDEQRLLEASRAARSRERLAHARRRIAALGAAAAVVITAGVAAWFALQQRRQLDWRDLLALDARIPTLLRMQPVSGLLAAIEAVDRSRTLNRDLVLPAIQTDLALALDQAREQFAEPLPHGALALAFSTDGRIAAATDDGTIEVFKADGSGSTSSIRAAGSGVSVRDVAFSSDATLIAAALGRQGIGVWDKNGAPLPQLPRMPDGVVTTLRFVPGGHTLVATFAAADGRSSLYLCDLDTREASASTIANQREIASMAVARNSSGLVLIATAGGDVRVWDSAGKPLLNPPKGAPPGAAIDVVDLTITPERRVLIAGGASDGTVTVWDVSPPMKTYGPFASGSNVEKLAFGADGRTVLVGGSDGFVRTYDLNGEEVVLPFSASSDVVTALAVSGDGQLAAVTASEQGVPHVRVIDMLGGEIQFPLPPPAPDAEGRVARANAMAFVPKTGALIAAGRTAVSWTIDAPAGQARFGAKRADIETQQDGITGLAVNASGSALLLVGGAGLEFHGGDGRLQQFVPLRARGRSIALSPDGRSAIVGDDAGGISLWDVPGQRLVRTIDAHRGTVWSVAFSPDGARFATGAADGRVRLWSADGSPLRDIAHPEGVTITALAFHPTDGTLFSGSNHGEVERYDTNGVSLVQVRVFRGDVVSALAVHPSGESVYAAGGTGLRVLDVDTASVITLGMHAMDKSLQTVAISADGRLLAGALDDGRIVLWRADWDDWLSEACNRLRRHDVFIAAARGSTPSPAGSETQGVSSAAAFDACTRRVWNTDQHTSR